MTDIEIPFLGMISIGFGVISWIALPYGGYCIQRAVMNKKPEHPPIIVVELFEIVARPQHYTIVGRTYRRRGIFALAIGTFFGCLAIMTAFLEILQMS